MTFKDLRKRFSLETIRQEHLPFDRLKNKRFWFWNSEQHMREDITTKGDCCFNHIIGLPRRERIERPLFDYQKIPYDTLFVKDYHNQVNLEFKQKHL